MSTLPTLIMGMTLITFYFGCMVLNARHAAGRHAAFSSVYVCVAGTIS